MVFETFIRYAGLAVGLKPSARGCEGRLRGLYRIISSKTISKNRSDAVEGCREASPPRTPVPARGGQVAWHNPHGPPAAGGHQPVGGPLPAGRRPRNSYQIR